MKVEAAKTHRCDKSTKLECKVSIFAFLDSLVAQSDFSGRLTAS
jgi:hypothetical protein